MSSTSSHSFIIRRHGIPYKIVSIAADRAKGFMERLRSRHPGHGWSIDERFPLCGAD